MKGNGAGSGLEEFRKRYSVEDSKIRKDKQLDDAFRKEFDRALEACDAACDVRSCADEFFNSRKLAGSKKRLRRNEMLGHVRPRRTFEDHVGTSTGRGRAWVRDLLISVKALIPSDRVAELVDQLTVNGRKIEMGRHVLWAYRNPDDIADPFNLAGTPDGQLPCRLGLATDKERDYVAWGIGPRTGREVRAPTAFDPGMAHLVRWQPGGWTKPDAGCAGHKKGVPEVVMEPPTFEHMTVDFKEIKAK